MSGGLNNGLNIGFDKIKIITTNFDVYDNLNLLNFRREVTVENTASNRRSVDRIMKNINKRNNNVSYEILFDKIKIKKHRNVVLNPYYKRKE